MTLSLENILRYWRMSLADGALGRGRFRNAERERFMQLSSDTLHSGKLPPEQAKRIFEGEDDTTQAVSVRLWPLVTARKSSHAATIRDGLPEIVAPIVTEGFVSREGRITPKSTTIARDILAPMPDGVFSIGTVDDLDGFLTRNPFLPDEQGYVWKQYRDHCHAMLDAVARGWPRCDRDYGANETGFLEVSDSAPATVRQILDLYDALLEGRPDTPLLESWCLPAPDTASLPDDGDNLAGRLGHSNDRFPLADYQRQVLTCLADEACGPVLAVNGPPGTGKTTMLLSAIADMWIRAALAQDDPPVVVAASTNNQAVTNIIDAFGKDFAHGQGPLAGRWLPGINSFGLFLPAASRENEAAAKYQTERFFLDVESEAYFVNAKKAFLSAGRAAFPELVDPDVSEIVSALHERIVAHAGLLAGVDRARQSLKIRQDELSAALGDNPDAAVKKLLAERDRQTANRDRQVAVKRQWQNHQASESVFMLLFGFLPPVARQRLLQAKIAQGAIDLETFRFTFVEAEKINAHTTRQMLEKLELTNPSMRTIHVFVDNARYHHAKVLQPWLNAPGRRVRLHFLPPYALHLNPIERLWGVMHKWVTHNRYYATFNQFADAVLGFFRQTLPDKWREFRDTLTDNFRIISLGKYKVI